MFDEDINQVMEMSLNEYINDLKKQIPIEPKEINGEVVKLTLRIDNFTFIRNFFKKDKLIVTNSNKGY